MRRGRPPYPDLLTPREQEVLALIREGLTNEQIAERLGISESGARYHVSEILSKLGVESRYEAAAWAGDLRTPLPASVPLLVRIRQLVGAGGVRLWAVSAVAIAAVALVALAIGVAINEAREADDQASGPTPTPGPEVRRMLELEAEAARLRDVIAPNAYIFRVQYLLGRNEESYGFAYSTDDGFVSINQLPPENSEAAWRISTVHVDQFAPEPLDIARVEHTPEDVYTTAVSRGAAPPRDQCGDSCLALALEADTTGTPAWQVIGFLGQGDQVTQVNCAVEDNAALQSMTCGPTPAPWFTATPSSPTPLPVQTATDVHEVVDIGLALARVFEPEAHLFALGSLVDNVFEFSHYRLGFTTPDGRTQIAMTRDRSQWHIEVIELDPGDPRRPLDVSRLDKGPREVALAGLGDGPFRANITLKSRDGHLVWQVVNNTFGQTTCTLADASPLSGIECTLEPPTPTPAPPTRTPAPEP